MSDDILYKITISPWKEMELSIKEYEVTSETAKSLMSDGIRFSKDHIDEPQIDQYVGHLHGASLIMYECTREDVEEFGVPKLKDAVRQWLKARWNYYDKYLKQLDK